MTLAGQVVDVETSKDCILLSVLVEGGDEGEAVAVRCVGQARDMVDAHVRRKSTVLVTGSLRLVPVHDGPTNKYFLNPVVHVADAMGTIAVLD